MKFKLGRYRPKLPKGEAEGKIIALRFDAEYLRRIDAAAKPGRQSRSEWTRNLLNEALESKC